MTRSIALSLALLIASAASASELQLWYAQPAAKWEEALPLGSGRMGAMVFGGTGEERIQFNEDTLWTGKPHDYVREGAHDHLREIQKLVFEGKQDEVADLVRKKFLSDPVRQKSYQPFGDLRFHFPGHENVADYRRELDLDSAVARVGYRVGDVTYQREVFASYPDNVIVVRLTASQPGKISFALKMDSPHEMSECVAAGNVMLKLTGQVRDTVPPQMGQRACFTCEQTSMRQISQSPYWTNGSPSKCGGYSSGSR